MNGYRSQRIESGAKMFHSTHRMMRTVIQTMKRPVPRKRAMRSENRPNSSGS
ncbi:hypothetical protein M2266_004691 [Streptomyces sp. SPB162]|nr:hypothetical protein [Streptomyces sp. SPB162]